MNLKVKMRNEDKQPIIPAFFFTFVFGIVGLIGLGWLLILILSFDLDFFMEEFSENGMAILILLSLGMIGLLLIYYLFKSPREYIGKLEKKENISYKGKRIWMMYFRIEGKENSSITLSCYTEEENNLVEGEKYAVLLKEFSWKIIKVSDINSLKKYDLVQTPTMKPVFFMFFFIFGLGFIFVLLKMIYDDVNGNNYLVNIIPLSILSYILYYLFKIYKE